MSNLKDLINLSKIDGGKFFVIDESGEAKLIIMCIEEYERLLLGKLQKQILDVENINKEILNAQLTEDQEFYKSKSQASIKGPSVMTKPAEPDITHLPFRNGHVDLRAEVIDPSFDFEGPKVEIDDL